MIAPPFSHCTFSPALYFRRTFKDVITLIPFVIILIIPLSPVGHVLVFGAIQRFFPNFFPSCFTEQRQNLLQLYENAEYTELTINETWKVRAVRDLDAHTVGMPRLVDLYISTLTCRISCVCVFRKS